MVKIIHKCTTLPEKLTQLTHKGQELHTVAVD